MRFSDYGASVYLTRVGWGFRSLLCYGLHGLGDIGLCDPYGMGFRPRFTDRKSRDIIQVTAN
jgi:hypothetical protein